jgi:Domain of unknown function (DUF4394)
MMNVSRRAKPAAYLFLLAFCACTELFPDDDAGPDPGDADAGPGGGGGGGPDAGMPGGGMPQQPGWPPPPPPPPSAKAYSPIYIVDEDNKLLLVSADAPSAVLSSYRITGLADGERVLGIDFRPATGGLYALGSTSTLYLVDPATGYATAVGAPLATPLAGASFGFDFNPTVDRIRVVSDAGENLRLNPLTGEIAGTDTNLA